MKLSLATKNLYGQKMFQILKTCNELEKKGKKIYHFEIGDPKFDTPKKVVDKCIQELKKKNTHYVPSSGLDVFKDAAIKRFSQTRGFVPKKDQILITQGGNIQIFYSLFCLTNKGDEIMIPDPSFVSYSSIINMLGLKCKKYDLLSKNDFQIDIDQIIHNFKKNKTKAIIINSPNNPTGSILLKKNLKKIYDFCKEKKIFLISDEVYGRLVYENQNFYSPGSFDHCKKTTILIHSLSKSYAMTGWRIGAVTAPKEIISKMQLLLETTSSCVPPFIQVAAAEAINSSQPEINKMVAILNKNRLLFDKLISDIDSISYKVPKGAFYYFINISKVFKNDVKFCQKLLTVKGVACCPGSYFGKNGRGFVRFSFATDTKTIKTGLKLFRDFLNNEEYL